MCIRDRLSGKTFKYSGGRGACGSDRSELSDSDVYKRQVLVHNHPSGDPAPSPEDVRMTHRIYKTGEMLGIQLLDHIIIGDHCYSSFRERGILSEEN